MIREAADPLFGYRHDWRKRLEVEKPSLDGQDDALDDALADYRPDWREHLGRVRGAAAAIFADPTAEPTVEAPRSYLGSPGSPTRERSPGEAAVLAALEAASAGPDVPATGDEAMRRRTPGTDAGTFAVARRQAELDARPTAENLLRGVPAGIAKGLTRVPDIPLAVVQKGAELVDRLDGPDPLPDLASGRDRSRPLPAVDQARATLADMQRTADRALDPQGAAGAVGEFAGEILPAAFTARAGSEVVGKLITKYGSATRLAAAIRAGREGSYLQRLLTTVATNAPVDVGYGLSATPEGENPLPNIGRNLALSAAGTALAEGVATPGITRNRQLRDDLTRVDAGQQVARQAEEAAATEALERARARAAEADRPSDVLTEPPGATSQLLRQHDATVADAQAGVAAREARRQARLEQPQSEIGRLMAEHDARVAAAQAARGRSGSASTIEGAEPDQPPLPPDAATRMEAIGAPEVSESGRAATPRDEAPPLVDDLSARRVGMPAELRDDRNVLGDAGAPARAPAPTVRVRGTDQVGTVIEPTTALLREEARAGGGEYRLVDFGGPTDTRWVHVTRLEAAERAADPTGAPAYLPRPDYDRPRPERPRRRLQQMGAPKFARLSDDELFARRHQVLDRMSRMSQVAGENITHWTRYDDDVAAQRSGTVVTNKAGRAIGRLKDDGRISDELDAELALRGYSDDEIARRYDDYWSAREERAALEAEGQALPRRGAGALPFVDRFMSDESGRIAGRTAARLAAPAVGAGVGSQIGDTPEERRRNAAIGAALGATLASRGVRRLAGRFVVDERGTFGRRAFIAAADGTPNLGAVPKALEHAGVAPGPIRFHAGESYILKHAQDIKAAGYASVDDYVRDVAANFSAVYRGKGESLVLVKRNGLDKLAYISLTPDPSGNYWRVTNGHPTYGGRLATGQRSPLWEAPRIASTGPGPSGAVPSEPLDLDQMGTRQRAEVDPQGTPRAEERPSSQASNPTDATPRALGERPAPTSPTQDNLPPEPPPGKRPPPSPGGDAERGATRPQVTATVAGAATGAAYGAASADPKKGESRTARALSYGIAGGVGGYLLAKSAGAAAATRTARPVQLAGADADVQAVLRSSLTAAPARAPKPGTRLLDAVAGAGRRAYQALVDDVYAARRLGRAVGGTEAVSQEASRARGWRGMGDELVGVRTRPAGSAHTAPTLREAVEAAKGREQDVVALLNAERFLELEANGLHGKLGALTPAQATAAQAKLAAVPEVRAAADRVRAFYRHLLDLRAQHGLIDPAQYGELLRTGQFYVPFVRDFGAERVLGGSSGGKLFNRSKGIRTMDEGLAKAPVRDPFQQAVEDAYATARDVSRQRVMNAVSEIVQTDPAKAAPYITDLGATAPKLSPSAKADGHLITAIVGGQRRHYQVVDEDLYHALASVGPGAQGVISKIFSPFARTLRAGVTTLPAFGFANASRDAFFTSTAFRAPLRSGAAGAAIGAAVGAARDPDDPMHGALRGAAAGLGLGVMGRHALRIGQGLGSIIRNDDLYQQWLREGGAGTGFFARSHGDAARLVKQLQGGSAADVLKPTSWWHAIEALNRAVEEAPRVAKFADDLGTGKSVPEAIAGSRDVSLDFSRGGGETMGLRQTSAFWNPKIQGLDKLRQVLNPVRNPRGYAIGLAAITAPTLALWDLNKDDPEYWRRPLWERNLFWLVPIGHDDAGTTRFLKIPKPFEVGFVFGSLPERALDFWYQRDPERTAAALKDMVGQVGQGIVPLPTAAVPVGEALIGERGYDTFRGREIVTRDVATLPAREQYTAGTSSTALGLSRAIETATGGLVSPSPQKVDHVVKGYTGSLGRVASDAIDQVARRTGLDDRPEPPTRLASQWARFVTRPDGFSTDDVRTMFRRFEAAEAHLAQVKQLAKAGTRVEAVAYVREHRDDLTALMELKDNVAAFRKVARARRVVEQHPGLTGEQKERVIRRLGLVASAIAAEAVEQHHSGVPAPSLARTVGARSSSK